MTVKSVSSLASSLAAVLLFVLVAFGMPQRAMAVDYTQCLAPYATAKGANGFNGNSCTANDVSFILLGLGTQNEGCVNPTDTAQVKLRAVIGANPANPNQGASTRYDIGMWINTEGQSALTDTNVACAREILRPVALTVTNSPLCKDYDTVNGVPSADVNPGGVDLTCGNARINCQGTPIMFPTNDTASSPPAPGCGTCEDTSGLYHDPHGPDAYLNCLPGGAPGSNGCPGAEYPCDVHRRFLNAVGENDACGDIQKPNAVGDCGTQLDPTTDSNYSPSYSYLNGKCNVPDTHPDNSVMDFEDAVPLPCGQVSNGFLAVSTCASWHTNAGQDCLAIDDAWPNQSSKCNCQTTTTNIPVPNLSASCGGQSSPVSIPVTGTCTPITGTNSYSCAYSYTNVITPVCTNVAGTLERDRCGTASYVYFELTDNGLNGTFSNITVHDTYGGDLWGQGAADQSKPLTTTGVLDWFPADQDTAYNPSPGGGVGIVGANTQAAIYFDYTPPSSNGTASVSLQGTTWWSNYSNFSSAANKSIMTCSFSGVTPVTLASVQGTRDGDNVSFDWTTQTSAGNIGFNLYGETAEGLTKLNRALIPAKPGASFGTDSYHFSTTADNLISNEFFISDVDVHGTEVKHGPFKPGVEYGAVVPTDKIDWASIKAEHEASVQQRRAQGATRGMRSATAAAHTNNAGTATPAVNIDVSQTGLYRVTYEQLANAGFDFGGAPAKDLALTNQGNDVGRVVTGGATFGPGSAIEFYGRSLDTLYTATNVYQLTVDHTHAQDAHVLHSASQRGSVAAYYLSTDEVHHRRTYYFGMPSSLSPWFDTLMAPSNPYSFTLNTDHFAGDLAASNLQVVMAGGDDDPNVSPDHHVEIFFDGAKVGNVTFDGMTAKTVNVTLPSGLVQDGSNTLQLVLPGDTGANSDYVTLVSYSLTYPRQFVAQTGGLTFDSSASRFQVTGLSSGDVNVFGIDGNSLTTVDRVSVSGSGGVYEASFAGQGADPTYSVVTTDGFLTASFSAALDGSSILQGPADYLIISHPDFMNDLGALVQAHTVDGMSVKVVDVDDVYAEFTHGIFDAHAIQDYIKYAVSHFGTKYVLLVGGDDTDYRHFTHPNAVSFIPTLYAPTGDIVRWAPSDPLLADVDGDGVPDVAIGRLPVRNATELANVIQKTLSYRARDYTDSAVFSADEFDVNNQVSFSAISDQMLSAVPSSWTKTKAYSDDLGPAGANQTLMAAIDSGVGFANFVGHSSIYQLGFPSILSTADVGNLTNINRPTVFAQWGCWNTYFSEANAQVLGAELLLSDQNGAAAVIGATTLTEINSERSLGRLLLPKLMQGETIGQAMLEAKQQLGKTGADLRDVLLGFTELGDPAIRVAPQQ